MFRKALFLSAIAASSILLGGLAQAQSQNNNTNATPSTPTRSLTPAAIPESQELFAVVNANGTLARGLGVVSSRKFASPPGEYEVIFNRDVSRCAYVATIGLAGNTGSSTPGEITTVGRFGNRNGVFITTHNSAGTDADRGFHLVVSCPR